MSPITRIILDGRTVWRTLLEVIDSRTVRLFQAIMYFFFLLNGVYAAFFSEPVSVVDVAMGSVSYTVWVWLNIVCPLMVMVGCYMAGHVQRGKLTSRATNGLLLQVFGDLGMTFTLSAYWVSMLYSAWWGKGTSSLFGYMGLSVCAALLVVGDIRRLVIRSEWSR
jgi:hypothetical protein